jgi:putative redox protein
MEAKVTWKGRMSFDAVADSGHVVRLGTKPEYGGDDDGASAMELVLMALVGCTASDVISIMGKKKQNVTSLEIKVHGDRVDEHPRIYKKLFVEYVIGGVDLDPKAMERSVQLSVEKYCSVQAMLGATVPIEHKITML